MGVPFLMATVFPSSAPRHQGTLGSSLLPPSKGLSRTVASLTHLPSHSQLMPGL